MLYHHTDILLCNRSGPFDITGCCEFTVDLGEWWRGEQLFCYFFSEFALASAAGAPVEAPPNHLKQPLSGQGSARTSIQAKSERLVLSAVRGYLKTWFWCVWPLKTFFQEIIVLEMYLKYFIEIADWWHMGYWWICWEMHGLRDHITGGGTCKGNQVCPM